MASNSINNSYIECPECGMAYMSDIPDNIKAHRKYHDKRVNGLCACAVTSDVVIWQNRDFRATVVTPFSPSIQLKRAAEIGSLTVRDTGFDCTPWDGSMPSNESNLHAFFLYKECRGMGYLLMEMCTHIWKATWTESEWKPSSRLINHPPMWSITMVWVLKKYRGMNLAKQLVDAALSYLSTSIESVGWYIPEVTPSGKAFVKRCCPESFYIAK